MKILIAEDDLTSRIMLKSVLTKWGFEVTSTRDGTRAFAALQQKDAPRLALLDWEMPGMEGPELCRKLREQAKNDPLYLILLTARTGRTNIVEGLDAGADDYILKPYDNMELHARINVGKRTLDMQSEIRQYAEKMESLAKERAVQLAHSDRMATLGILSAGIAHEINNPASFISVNIQTLEENWTAIHDCIQGTSTPEKTRLAHLIAKEAPEIFSEMKSGIDRIHNIVNSLKTYSRSDSGKRMNVRIPDCVDMALRLCVSRLKNRVSIQNHLADDLPPIRANASELEQVFINLFINAADAMETRSNSAIIISAASEPDGLHIRIRDTGPGIPADQHGMIFAPFFTTKRIGKGTGLGLSISKNIIEDHGGTLTAKNHPEGGAEFCIFFPINSLCMSVQSGQLT